MIAKFNFYDFIANLVPGLTFLWALERLGKLVGWDSPFPMSGQLAETSILVVLTYVAGIMLQAIAERITEKKILFRLWEGFPSARWLLPGNTRFSPAFKQRILDLIAERFKIVTAPDLPQGCTAVEERQLRLEKNQELFYLCYNYVDNLSPRPQIFNAQYGIFRCLLTTFALLCAMSILLGIWNYAFESASPRPFVVWAAIFAVLTWLAYVRCHKRAEDFAKAIYDLFISGVAKPGT